MNKQLLELYREIQQDNATGEHFEKAIKEQGLTVEIIYLVSEYYKNDIIDYKKFK